jgi:hypothetical protein
MPTGNAIAIFFNSLGGAVSISVAQNVFSNGLYKNIPKYAPDIPVNVVVAAGATSLRKAVEKISPSSLPGVLQGLVKFPYKKAIFFYVSSGAESCFRSQ